MENIPQSDPSLPSFPITSTSYNFQNCHFHIPKLEVLSGFLISLSLNYDQNAAAQHHTLVQQSKTESASTPVQQQQASVSPSPSKGNTPNSPQQSSSGGSGGGVAGSGYITSLFAAVKNEIVGTMSSELQGVGFVDLRQLMNQRDIYHNITVAIMSHNHVVCKMDLSVVIPGMKTEIYEMRNFIVQQKVKPSQTFVKCFEKMVRDSNDLMILRNTKLKVEAMANEWMNSHVADRIEVFSVDTTHINSRGGYELFTVQVWYKYLQNFIDEAKQLEEERLKKEEELAATTSKPSEEGDIVSPQPHTEDSTKQQQETDTTVDPVEASNEDVTQEEDEPDEEEPQEN